jgi:hypothetical protein
MEIDNVVVTGGIVDIGERIDSISLGTFLYTRGDMAMVENR